VSRSHDPSPLVLVAGAYIVCERVVSEAERPLLVDVERTRDSLRGFIGDVKMMPGENCSIFRLFGPKRPQSGFLAPSRCGNTHARQPGARRVQHPLALPPMRGGSCSRLAAQAEGRGLSVQVASPTAFHRRRWAGDTGKGTQYPPAATDPERSLGLPNSGRWGDEKRTSHRDVCLRLAPQGILGPA